MSRWMVVHFPSPHPAKYSLFVAPGYIYLFSEPATVVPEMGVSTKPTDKDEFHASWAEVGGTGRLVCRVRAAPQPTFVWSSSSDLILLNSDKYTIHEPQVTVLCNLMPLCPTDTCKFVTRVHLCQSVNTPVSLISKHTCVIDQ